MIIFRPFFLKIRLNSLNKKKLAFFLCPYPKVYYVTNTKHNPSFNGFFVPRTIYKIILFLKKTEVINSHFKRSKTIAKIVLDKAKKNG